MVSGSNFELTTAAVLGAPSHFLNPLLLNGILLFFEDGRRGVHQCEELCTTKAGARSSGRYYNFFSLAICIPTLSFCARNFAQRD